MEDFAYVTLKFLGPNYYTKGKSVEVKPSPWSQGQGQGHQELTLFLQWDLP